jgi:pimeloyl-ACP methyl ester carboxylesterase
MNYGFVFRSLLCITGFVLLVPILMLILIVSNLPITASGIGYIVGSFIAIIGLILAPWVRRYPLLFLIGAAIIALVAGIRLIAARQLPVSNIKMISLPEGKQTRWLNYIIDEQDSLIFGEAFFHRIGGDSDNEHNDLTSALLTDYSEMRSVQKLFPSPFLSTYLALQRPNHFDAVVIEPEIDPLPKFAVVFLHGYMGNVAAQCWEIAQAVKVFGAVTVCPSTDWTGAWWQPQGQAILQETFKYVKSRGIEKFYLGGFSNGGISINRLASQLKNERGLRGLIFIDGIFDGASIKETNLPVLVIQGTQDERIPFDGVRQVVEVIGDSVTYVELDADHFLIMKQPRRVQYAIIRWLEKFEPPMYVLPVHFGEK